MTASWKNPVSYRPRPRQSSYRPRRPPRGPHEDKLDLIVVNKGAEAMTIGNVGVQSEDGSRTIDVRAKRDNGQHIDGPEFPG